MGLAVFTLAIVIRRIDTASLASQFQASTPRRILAAYL
jgi:hypothetical protein